MTPSAPAAPAGRAAPLTRAYRVMRPVAPPEAPFEGVLAAEGDRTVLLADAAGAADRLFVGRDPAPQHLLAPLDLVRTRGGHDVELPWCRDALAPLLAQRRGDGRPLSGGELVTLAVSLLRGVREAREGVGDAAASRAGSWWLADDGRPLFVAGGDGARPAEAQAADLLAEAQLHTTDRVLLRHLARARDAVAAPQGLPAGLPAIEDALFDACAPRPLRRPAAERRTAATLERPSAAIGGPVAAAAPERAAHASRLGRLVSVLPAPLDAAVARPGEAAATALRAMRRRLPPGRGRALLAVAAAGLVLAVGLLWPAGSGPDAPGGGGSARWASPEATGGGRALGPDAPAALGEPEAAHRESAPAAPPASEQPVAAATRLLAGLAECAAAGDRGCPAVRDDAGEPLPEEVLRAASGPHEVALVDDYGDVAVVRVDAGGHAVLMQLVRWDGRWALRAAHALGSR